MSNLGEGGRFNLRVVQGGRDDRRDVGQRRRVVIVVDDEETSRELLGSVVKRLGCPRLEVHGFAAPADALSFARERRIDLGLIDLHLGVGQMDGLELVNRIRRETPSGEGFSAILITADTEPMVVYEATRRNVAVVMEKAVDLYRLALRCCALLGIPPPEE